MFKHVACIVCTLVLTNVLNAQTPPVFNLSTAQGLPSTNIYRVCQDEKGFLWVATENGLCRYDGSEIKVWDTRNDLPDNSVIHVSHGYNGQLWICTYNGGICLLKNENLTTLSDSLRLVFEQIIKTAHTRKSIWLINSRKWIYNLKNGHASLILHNAKDTLLCKSILQVDDTSCIFLTQLGLFKYGDNSGIKQVHLSLDDDVQIVFPLGEKLFALAGQKVYIINDSLHIDSVIRLDKKHIWNDVVDSKGSLWMASGSELMRLESTGKLVTFKDLFKYHPIVINDLFVDSWDNIWVATYGAGLYCFWNKDIADLSAIPDKIHHNITSLYAKNDNVFISSLGGVLTRYNKGEIRKVPLSCNGFNDYVYFNLMRNDTLIIGKNNGLCFATNIESEKSQKCSCTQLKEGAISGLIDSRGRLWIGHYTGISYHDRGKEVWIDAIKQKRVNAICEYPNGTFYIGTDKGLYSSVSNTVFQFFCPTKADAKFVTSLVADKAGNLWIGTRGGLYIKQAGKLSVKPYDHALLSRTKISQIIETSDGAIWIASYQGVYRFYNKKLIAFTRHNGLMSNHILSIAMDAEKKLWAGTPDGISIIGREQYDAETGIIPRLFITSVGYRQKTEMYPKQISVRTTDRNIIVNFTAILLPASTQIKFEYRIIGLNDEWQELPNRSLVLSSLPKGKHRLEIRTSTYSPQDKTEYVSLEINVVPMFYEQLSFKITIGILLVIFFALMVNYRIWAVRKRERTKHWRKMRIMYLRLQAVQTSLNPHFIFNSLNSILSLLKTGRNEQAEIYLSGFSKLLRNTLETSANTSITLKKEIERLNQYLALEKVRFADTFVYKIEVLGDLDIERAKIPIMVVQPFVENALKHGIRGQNKQEGMIKIVFEGQKEILIIRIEDNGIGYYTSLKLKGETGHRSLGIQMVQKQLALLNGAGRGTHTVTITEKVKGQGTLVEISLPLEK